MLDKVLYKIFPFPQVKPIRLKLFSKYFDLYLNNLRIYFWMLLITKNNKFNFKKNENFNDSFKENPNFLEFNELNKNGVVTINDLLPIDLFNDLLNYLEIKIKEEPNNKRFLENITFSYWEMKGVDYFYQKINSIINPYFMYFYNKPLNVSKPFIQRIDAKNKDLYDPDTILHIDKFIPSLKIFYFPYDVSYLDAPFVYKIGSHIFDDDYRNNVERVTKNIIFNNQKPSPFSFYNSSNVKEIIVKKNSLVIAWTHGEHARKKFIHEGSRISIRITTYDRINKLTLFNCLLKKY
jgi:hypothetical protein